MLVLMMIGDHQVATSVELWGLETTHPCLITVGHSTGGLSHLLHCQSKYKLWDYLAAAQCVLGNILTDP